MQQRRAGLIDEGLHHHIDGLLRHRHHRPPEILSLSVRPRVLRQVRAYALAEGLFPEPVLHHAQHRGALAVCDSVKKLADRGRCLRGRANRTRGALPVDR